MVDRRNWRSCGSRGLRRRIRHGITYLKPADPAVKRKTAQGVGLGVVPPENDADLLDLVAGNDIGQSEQLLECVELQIVGVMKIDPYFDAGGQTTHFRHSRAILESREADGGREGVKLLSTDRYRAAVRTSHPPPLLPFEAEHAAQ